MKIKVEMYTKTRQHKQRKKVQLSDGIKVIDTGGWWMTVV